MAIIKTLFSIGKENAAPKKSGMKRKTGKLIPVQNNNKARRVQLSRGRGNAGNGRKVKDVEARSQMSTDEAGNDIVYHTLPKQKKTETTQPHSLKQSVSKNISNPKKHLTL